MALNLDEMGMTNRYIRNRMFNKAANPNAVVESALNSQIDSLQKRVEGLSQTLISRQAQAVKALNELVEEAKQINPCKPSEEHLDRLMQSIQELTHVRQTLQGTLLQSKEELANRRHHQDELLGNLRKMQLILKSTPQENSHNREALLSASGSLNRYISYNT